MISLRSHVVTLLAVLLALAVGVALGSGPLQSPAPTAATSTGGTDPAEPEQAAETARLAAALEHAEEYVRATAPDRVDRLLRKRAVTLVTLPGADAAGVAELATTVARADGVVTARLTVTEKLLDAADRQLVAELADQLTGKDELADELHLPGKASGYDRVGALLARAVTTPRWSGEPPDDAAERILAGLRTAGLVESDEVRRRGSLVLVVAGEPFGSSDQRAGAGSIVPALLGALDEGGRGLVLGGPTTSVGPDGLLGAVRAATVAETVSTVEGVDRPAGAVLAVLALAGEQYGRAGHHGSPQAPDGLLPDAGAPTKAEKRALKKTLKKAQKKAQKRSRG